MGHVGDGNFHLFILIDPKDKNNMEEAKKLNNRLILRALAMEGTCTGEHGVGLGKKVYLEQELGKETVDLMRSIKKLIDPKNIMNPGKKVDLIDEDNRENKVTNGTIVNSKVLPNGRVSVSITWDKAKL